ncbi:MAG: L-threonylcarbamoyladenylate synthase [Halioglobus sp.]|jgi:L-threonylcarbamoyladenylate synthase
MLFDDKLSDIIKTLESDGVLLHATDTIWGLACSSLSEKGLDKIYNIKNRDKNKPILMLVDSVEMIKKHVPHIHPRIETLLLFHKKPLTIVYPNVIRLPLFSLAGNGSAAIRITADPFTNQIIKLLGCPLMSTSANISNDPFAQSFREVSQEILNKVDFISKHRKDEKLNGKPSVMIDYNGEGEISFLRL